MSKLVYESLLEFQRGKPSEALSLGKKKEVDEWIKEFIPYSQAKINSKWMIDVKEVIIPRNRVIGEIPEFIQFGVCQGKFLIRDNQLTSMAGCPKVVKGDFMVDGNKLVDLDGSPEEVGGDYYIRKNNEKFTVEQIEKICKVGGRIIV